MKDQAKPAGLSRTVAARKGRVARRAKALRQRTTIRVTKITALSAQQALTLLARTVMRPFTPLDWSAFSGCESDTPMIGETALGLDTSAPAAPVLLIVDGAQLVIYVDGDRAVDPNGVIFEGVLGEKR